MNTCKNGADPNFCMDNNINKSANPPCSENMDKNYICKACGNTCRQNKCAFPCEEAYCQCQGGESQIQGDLTENQGDQNETQGDLTENQGNQTESQGDQAQVQGALSQNQGNQAESLGDQAQLQGALTENQGDQTESLGDLIQSQGGETQGNQTQGDQIQALRGHDGQIQGDQNLTSNPTISTPVTVSGVNFNVTVHCGKEGKKEKCKCECKDTIAELLCLVQLLQLSVNDQRAAEVKFYYYHLQNSPIAGNLIDNTGNCLFTFKPTFETNIISVSTEALEVLEFTDSTIVPNLFSLLLSYLKSGVISICCKNNCCENNYYEGDCCGNDCCDICSNNIFCQLQIYMDSQTQIEIGTATAQITGYIYKIQQGIVYLADDLQNPTKIYAIPVCKIIYYQPQET